MASIVTLTLNPTVDLSSSVSRVVSERKLRCAPPVREPGGGGLNVARVVRTLGHEALALWTRGGPDGQMLHQLLEGLGVSHQPIDVQQPTRTNVIIFDESTTEQYRFGFPGPTLSEPEWLRCLQGVLALPPPDILVLSGSLPPGVPADFYARVASRMRGRTRVVVDTSGEPLRQVAQAGVFLLKPNLRELQDLVGHPLDGNEAIVDATQGLISAGNMEVAMVSLGAGGALVVTREESFLLPSPTVPIRSKVGAGDSMVGGVVTGLVRGMSVRDAARLGVAAGAAAVMSPGTELCRRADVERLFSQVG